ncbi:hypothetical protein WR25_02161 [Diploscapter pachys]|uniref:Uncharacterized protein n=1 Tax=Diploscapter pachys TaxID=2018661 RepID=A0A2A2M2V9_9BILA|nr:hypothetical protein WR25_02161 [Diploscapter pachys]
MVAGVQGFVRTDRDRAGQGRQPLVVIRRNRLFEQIDPLRAQQGQIGGDVLHPPAFIGVDDQPGGRRSGTDRRDLGCGLVAVHLDLQQRHVRHRRRDGGHGLGRVDADRDRGWQRRDGRDARQRGDVGTADPRLQVP